MKKSYLFLCLSIVLGISVKTLAQTDPGTANLTHQWTFDDGTAKDVVGTADGTLQGNATITSKALNTLNGGYLSLPASAIGINSYTAITVEAWFTSAQGANTGFTMLSYFGNTTGTTGTEYVTMSAARGDGFSRAAISTGNETSPWGTENGVNSAKYDDGIQHHMVSVYDTNGVTFYIDGALIGTTPFTGTNAISSIGTQFGYLCKSGYTGDPTWKGSIHKFSLYNTALTADNILYLYQHGAEAQAAITTTAASLAFDSNYPAETFNVTSSNLSADITVAVPAGILLLDASGNNVTKITKNTANVSLTAVYDGSVILVNGNITMTSGTMVVTIPVKSADDAACYVPMYPNGTNLIETPGMNTLSTFQGWGAKSIVTILTDPANVYCGAASIEVGDGTATGSLDQSLTGLIVKNATYRVRAMVKTMDGGFNFGTGQTDPEVIIPMNTNGVWQQIDFSFTTGANMGAAPLIYFNDYNCTGRTAYIDNYQLYLTENPVIATSVKSYIADDKTGKNFKISTTAANLTKDITITAPAGIVLSKSVISKDSVIQAFTATYDGTTAVDGNIVLTSDTVVVKIAVKSETSTACFTPLFTGKTNLIADPYMNNTSAGWGSRDLILAKDYPDSVFCGVSCGRIFGSGDFDLPLTGLITPNTDYTAKAMVLTLGGYFQMGVFRVDSVNTADITDSINTNGVWQAMTFHFTTGVGFKKGSTQGMFFNNSQHTGRRAFIDNWELYQASPQGLPSVSKRNTQIYVRDGKIVASFDLENATQVQFDVYNVQGMLLSTDRIQGVAGGNSKVLNTNLQTGVYLVKMTQKNQSFIQKLVK